MNCVDRNEHFRERMLDLLRRSLGVDGSRSPKNFSTFGVPLPGRRTGRYEMRSDSPLTRLYFSILTVMDQALFEKLLLLNESDKLDFKP